MHYSNLHEFFESRCSEFSDSYLFDGEITYSWAFLMARSRAAFLQKCGFKKGDVAAILAVNSAEWCITYMAMVMCGVAVLALDPNLPQKDYPKMMKAVGASCVFVSSEYAKKAGKAKCYDISFKKNISDPKKYKCPTMKTSDAASYLFTSGTTGKPKIVVLTHGNLINTSVECPTFLGVEKGDKYLCILPLFHSYAFVANFSGPFYAGASLYFLRSLKGPDIVKALSENRFSTFPAAPQLWEIFIDAIFAKAKSASVIKYLLLKFFLSAQPVFKFVGLSFIPRAVFSPIRNIFGPKMKFLVSGGAPLKRKYFRYYQRLGLTILEGYGLTETTGPISITHPKKNKEGSVGPIFKGNFVVLKNVNEDGIGEIWVKGLSVTPGYYRNPRANAEAFDSDEFFNTGDIGRIDSDGYIFITGRSKNTIVLDSGKNVYPAELEAYYKQSDLIAEICVFGRKIGSRNVVWAAVVPVKKGRESYKQIRSEIARLSSGLPSYKVLGGFSLSFDPLPKNTTRKILVHEVASLVEKGAYQSGEDEKVESAMEFCPENDRQAAVASLLMKKFKLKKLFANDPLYELGLDSLSVIDFVSSCEDELSLSVDASRLCAAGTVEELISLVSSSSGSSGRTLDDVVLRGKISMSRFNLPNPAIPAALSFIRFFARRFWNLKSQLGLLDCENSIIAANHISLADSAVFLAELSSAQRKKLWVIGKKELHALKILFPGLNVLFVDRGGDVVPALKASADVLRSGGSLLIFPEGRRSECGVGAFKNGAAYLAKNLHKKIVPLVIRGTDAALPRGRVFPVLKGVSVSIEALPVMLPQDYDTVEKMNADLEKTIREAYMNNGRKRNEKTSGKGSSKRGKRA